MKKLAAILLLICISAVVYVHTVRSQTIGGNLFPGGIVQPPNGSTVPDTLNNFAGYTINAQAYGAKFDGTFVATGVSIPAGSTTLTCTTCTFTSADVGKLVYLQNANTNGGFWKAAIASFTDATHVVLDTPAPNWMVSQVPVTATVTSTTGATGYNPFDTLTITGGATHNGYPGVTLASQGSGGNNGTAFYSVDVGGSSVCSVQPRVGVIVSGGKITSITSNGSNGTCTTYPSGAGLSLTYFSGAGNNVAGATVNSISSPTQLIVATTKVATATITASGGTAGHAGVTCTITGTTGGAGQGTVPITSTVNSTQKFIGTALLVADGTLSGAITLTGANTSQGIYNRSPVDLNNEPVTITGTFCPTTGTAVLTMGPQQVIWDPNNQGNYFVGPAGTLSTSSSGGGTGATVTIAYGNAQGMWYGTDNAVPLQNALNYCAGNFVTAGGGQFGGCTVVVPPGVALISAGLTINTSYVAMQSSGPLTFFSRLSTSGLVGQGASSSLVYVNNTPPASGYMLEIKNTSVTNTLQLGNSIQGIGFNCMFLAGCSDVSIRGIYGGDYSMQVVQPFPIKHVVKNTTTPAFATSINQVLIANAGSGGTNGTAIFNIEGGSCSVKPQINVTIAGGALSTVNYVFNPGICTTIPPPGSSMTKATSPPGCACPGTVPTSAQVTPNQFGNVILANPGTASANNIGFYTVNGGTCTIQPIVQITSSIAAGAASARIGLGSSLIAGANPGNCTVSPPQGATLTYASGVNLGLSGTTVNMGGGGSVVELDSTTGLSNGQIITSDGFISGTSIHYVIDGTHIAASTLTMAPLAPNMQMFIEGIGLHMNSIDNTDGSTGLGQGSQNLHFRELVASNAGGISPAIIGDGTLPSTNFDTSADYFTLVNCWSAFADCLIWNTADHNIIYELGNINILDNPTLHITGPGYAMVGNGKMGDPTLGPSGYIRVDQGGGGIKFRGPDEGGQAWGSYGNVFYFLGAATITNGIALGTGGGITGATGCFTNDRYFLTCNPSPINNGLPGILLDYSGALLVNSTSNGAVLAGPLMTPSSGTAACTKGTLKWDANYFYVCTATNVWSSVTLSPYQTNKLAVLTASQILAITCNGAAEGTRYAVTDANSTTFNASLAGSGSNHMIAYCNGSTWVVH